MKTKKLITETLVHYDFPYPDFKTKEAWLKEVREKWTAFSKAFEETKVFKGSFYYPFKVGNWLAAFECNEINMNRLMDEYCNGTSNEPTGERITPPSMETNEVKILKDEIIQQDSIESLYKKISRLEERIVIKDKNIATLNYLISTLSETIATLNYLIASKEERINCYKKMLDIPVKPERTLRIV